MYISNATLILKTKLHDNLYKIPKLDQTNFNPRLSSPFVYYTSHLYLIKIWADILVVFEAAD